MLDKLPSAIGDVLTGGHDGADRVVLKAYFSLAHSPGQVQNVVAALA